MSPYQKITYRKKLNFTTSYTLSPTAETEDPVKSPEPQHNGSDKDHAFDPDVFTMRRCLPIRDRKVSTPPLASNFTTSYPRSPTAETEESRYLFF